MIRWHRDASSEYENGRPFPYSLSLEDLNSDSQEFSIAYAAMGSAAFPGATEPLPLWYYKPEWEANKLQLKKSAVVRVVDGGLYENYGLAAVLETYDYLRRKMADRSVTVKLKILSVDSANRIQPPRDESCVGLQSPPGVGSPVRGAVPAVETMSRSYDAGPAVIRSILARRATATGGESGTIETTEINLAHCSYYDQDNSEAVQTNYLISEKEIQTLEACADELVRQSAGGRSFLE